MNTPLKEDSSTDPKRPEEGVLTESQKADLDTTVRHLRRVFSEIYKTEATENPEVGCVPWYHFPDAPKKP
jgi:hypothetical protein